MKMIEKQTIMAVFAHPDDEVFGIGGTLACYAQQGAHVVLVCATRGEAGEIAEGTSATPDNLGQVREQELRCAADVLGISELIFLNYRDSGMAGTPENDDPRAFVNAPAEEVVKRLVSIIHQQRPQVVITFDPQGAYGHPDHIAIHQHTVAAFDVAGDDQYLMDAEEPWQPQRLFYSVLLRSQMEEFRQQMIASGVDPSEFDSFEEQGIDGWPDELVNLTFDTQSVTEIKQMAFACHQTQFSGDNFFSRIPEADLRKMIRYEYLVLARPEPTSDLVLTDLFAL